MRPRSHPLPAIAIAAAAACGALAPGCGPGLYVINVLPASSSVHSAEEVDAAEWAPYEYWTAHEYLEKAAEEANEGNYQDAIRFAERAAEYGRLARDLATERRSAASSASSTSGGDAAEQP